MPALNVVILVLGVLASCHLTTGQFGGWQSGNGGSWFGRNNIGWDHQDHEKADRAVCASEPSGISLQITIKRRSNGWWGTSLELEYEATASGNLERKYRLVATEFGGDDNDGACNQDNLGNLVKGRNQRSSWSWTSRGTDGDLGEVDLTSGEDSGTIRNLPFSNLKDAFGCGIALCDDVEEDEDEDEKWHSMHSGWARPWQGWQNRGSGTTKKCTGQIPICCHLGKSDKDAMITPYKRK